MQTSRCGCLSWNAERLHQRDADCVSWHDATLYGRHCRLPEAVAGECLAPGTVDDRFIEMPEYQTREGWLAALLCSRTAQVGKESSCLIWRCRVFKR
jgi:hypothetical protein